MGVASGGLFRTTDSGATWVPITDGKVPLGSTKSSCSCGFGSNIIYLGTGSDGVRSNVSTGRGIYKSTDGGQTWKFSGLYNAGQIGAVRIHPTNPDIVWVSAVGRRLQTQRGAWCIQDNRWRADVAQSAVCFRSGWRDGCRAAAGQSKCRVCVDVARSSASPGRSSAVRATADSTRAPTAASTSPRSQLVCPPS